MFADRARLGAQEQDETVRYVTEEVNRLKDMFHEREARLTSERDKASTSCLEASARCTELEKDLENARSKLAAAALEAEAGLSVFQKAWQNHYLSNSLTVSQERMACA